MCQKELAWPQVPERTKIEFGIVNGLWIANLRDEVPAEGYWVVTPEDCVELARLTANARISLKPDRPHPHCKSLTCKLCRSVCLRRRQMQNQIASSSIQALYALAGEVACQSILADIVDDIQQLQSAARQSEEKGFNDFERYLQIEQLGLKAHAQIAGSTSALDLADAKLHQLLVGLPCGPVSPDVALIDDPVDLDIENCLCRAKRHRPECDALFEWEKKLVEQSLPIQLTEGCAGDRISYEVREAVIRARLKTEQLWSANEALRLADEQLTRQLNRESLFRDSEADVRLARIVVNEKKLELVRQLVEYQITKIQLDEACGTFAVECPCCFATELAPHVDPGEPNPIKASEPIAPEGDLIDTATH